MTPYASTIKGSGHDSILVPFILVSGGTLYLTDLGIPFTLCIVILEYYTLEYYTEARMCKP